MARKIPCAVLSFLAFSLLITSSVLADGGIWFMPDEISDWELLDEEQQLCAIYYEDGFQNMLLTIGLSQLEGEKAIWIFPVPAGPDETVIDIIKGFPSLSGDDVGKEAEEAVSYTFSTMRMTQPYFGAPYILLGSFGTLGTAGSGLYDRALKEQGVTVHERIEKMGLTTELITAERPDAFYDYLSGKDVDLPESSRAIFDEYMGKEYSFVVSWISDIDEFKNTTVTHPIDRGLPSRPYEVGAASNHILGVFISFPTEKIYYPLKPTSVYGSLRIPTVIYVMSHVTPELYPGIAKDAEVNYYHYSYHAIPDYLSSFFNGKSRIDDFQFTKIRLNTPSKLLTEDLWILNSPPFSVAVAQFLYGYASIWGFAVFIIASCLSSMLAGWKMFRHHEPRLRNFALLGLANCTSLIGFLFISHGLRIGERFSKYKNPKKKLDYLRIIETALVVTFIPVLFYLSLIFTPILFYLSSYYALILTTFVVSLFLAILPFSWSYYKDRKLFKFIVLFSLTFVAISYALEILIQLIT